MKTIRCLLLIVAVLAVLPTVANSQYPGVGHKLSIFSDEALTDSTLADDAPRIVALYVVHAEHTGSVGVRFATAASVGFTGVWLSESSSYVTIGNSMTDISVGYGACLLPPVLVLTMSYQLFGTSETCSQLRIAPPAGFAVAICDDGCFGESWCRTGGVHVNCPVAVEPTTWGRVKALYRN